MTLDSASQSPASAGDASTGRKVGFVRRNRIALGLAVIALGIYAGSIVWFVLNRGAV